MTVGAFLAAPICYAGGAVTLVPADDTKVPSGSFISEHRINKIETEVKEFKAKMKEKAEKQQQEQSLQNDLSKPNGSDEK